MEPDSSAQRLRDLDDGGPRLCDQDRVDQGDVDALCKAPHVAHCLLYTSDAADERSSVDLGGRRIITKNTYIAQSMTDQLTYS